MDKRIDRFNEYFSNWEITLPDDAETHMGQGQIVKRGWTIKFLFGENDQGKFLDFYAAHRMTNDSHVRIRTDGSTEGLPALPDGLIVKAGEDPAEAERQFHEESKRVTQLLQDKGFAPNGSEHPSFLINNYLRHEAVDSDPGKSKDNID